METSQEQNSISKQETEDSIARLSSCSSSSSCSSIEAEPKPDQDLNNNQSPRTQTMERIDTTTTSSPKTPSSYRIPSHAFARATSKTPVDWSCLSNESLFSIRMGNNSFVNGDNFFKSGELSFPQPPSPVTPSLSTPNNRGGEEAKAQVDIGKKAAETEKTSQASKEEEQKAAASIREVIMANEAANNNNNKKPNKFDRTVSRTVSRRSEDLSVKSFAFPVLGNADKGGLQGASTQKKQPEIPKISTEGDEELKKEEVPASDTPSSKAEATKSNPKWLSCFPCCG